MNDLLIINGSPRRSGTSAMFCQRCADALGGEICHLYGERDSVDWLLPRIDAAGTIILSGPCYIDSYPGKVIFLLEKIAEQPEICHGQKVYGIINGGMPYVHTHDSGVRMLELFCRDCNMEYMGGFVLGLAPMLDGKPLENHFNAKKAVPAFRTFLEHIRNGEMSPDQLSYDAQFRMPRLLLRFLAWRMCRRVDMNLKKHGFTYSQKSPYWGESRGTVSRMKEGL